MKDQNNKIWIGMDDLTDSSFYQESAQNEFNEVPIVDTLANKEVLETEASRRDFLKYLGFGLGAATLAAGCDIPVRRAIPYVVKNDELVPGVATYYASSFVNGGDYCAILVKTREGRPIKIEGNSLSKVTKGGTSARVQASVLSLYDYNRLKGPARVENERPTGISWEEIDKNVRGGLNEGSKIVIVANTILSPTSKKALEDFTSKYPNTEVVMYDPISASAMLQANEESFGDKVIPDYHFDHAKVIVSFGADFLGTWISPVEYAADYVKNRKIKDIEHAEMSRHIQFESQMSLTGSNADHRVFVKPSEQGAAIANLYNEIASLNGSPSISAPAVNDKAADSIRKIARELNAHKGEALVVAGSNNIGEQVLVNAINNLLGSYGSTISFTNASLQRQGIDRDVQGLIRDMNAGSVDAVFVWGANPAFDLPNSEAFAEGLSKVGLKVSFNGTLDETSALCDYLAPSNHFLESWGDAEPKRGQYSLIQPTISPLFDTRQVELNLLSWCDSENLDRESEQPYFDYLKKNWEENMFSTQNEVSDFRSFWDATLHDGIFEIAQTETEASFAGDALAAASQISKPSNSELEIGFYESVNMGSGQYAENPWLMEMPDPITRTVWGNFLAIPVSWDGGNEFSAFKGLNPKEIRAKADKVELDIEGVSQEVTAVRQFGQMLGTVALAIGFGRKIVSQTGRNIGTNVFPWLSIDANGNTQYYASGVAISEKTGTDKEFACVQHHHTMGVKGTDPKTNEEINVDEKTIASLGSGYQGSLVDRTVIRQTNLNDLEHFAEELHHEREHHQYLNAQTLYPKSKHDYHYEQGHHWGMYVDLNACTGCGACTVACMAENNVPVVGKREVSRHHEMTWLRIDRYYYGDYENPNVVYQPMMCQHCDNAPCENVCPVAATNHSSEGLNQMTYNRCIGTRYCANNCPFKVRRFNWLDYTAADLFPINQNSLNGETPAYYTDNLVRMVLNPDVTVRSRGVIEKCSFCVQRLQDGKLRAKNEGRRLRDADIKSACQTSCPTGAIVFGDMNNKEGELSQELGSSLNYIVLEEINALSSVNYSAKVINRDEELS